MFTVDVKQQQNNNSKLIVIGVMSVTDKGKNAIKWPILNFKGTLWTGQTNGKTESLKHINPVFSTKHSGNYNFLLVPTNYRQAQEPW